MSGSNFREREIFSTALEHTVPARRSAYLDEACGDNVTLRESVESLLRVYDLQGGLLMDGIGASPDPVGAPIREGPGSRIGRYKLLELLGEGGFGVVYMAEQEEPVRRRVALKIIKLGMDTRAVVARFEAERQALALMEHPNIARVFDGGATDSGRPYFVMELVRGIPITRYCDQNRLPPEARLRLFIAVCHAVQHAHQKGIIHRDLKPSNVLVTINDDAPVPKVIDFGIAKATEQRLTDKTLFTLFEQFIGTPAYMSPEQALMTSLDVDTRSDIYSLGVLLYELLTGRTPFDAWDLLKAGVDEMRRTIREVEPPRPSSRLHTLTGEELTTTAMTRRANPPELIHLMRGDLDWIVMKCLEKDRTRRYETASGLAMDLRRHLEHEPVLARPPNPSYLLRKYIQRHRTGVAAGSVVLLSLVLGLLFALVGYRKARVAQREAEFQRVAAVNAQSGAENARDQAEDLIAFMMQDLTPALEQYGRLPLLKGVAEKADRYFAKLPIDLRDSSSDRGRAAALETLAGVEGALGNRPAAEAALRSAIEVRERLATDDAGSMARLLIDQRRAANYEPPRTAAEWEAHNRDMIERFRRLLERYPDNVTAKRGLAEALVDFSQAAAFYYDKPEDAIGAASEARLLWEELMRNASGDKWAQASYSGCLDALAGAYHAAGENERSAQIGEQAVAQVDESLRSDPGNLRLRGVAAAMARRLSARLATISHRRARDVELVARERFRILLELDPANANWRAEYAWAHQMEPQYLWADGQIESARAALRKFELILESHVPPDLPTVRGAVVRLSLRRALAAARAGDTTDCEAQLQKAQSRFESYHATLRENSINPHQARAVWLHGRCQVAHERRDGPELARLARELLDEVALGLGYQPDNGELLLRRAVAQSFLGAALLHDENPSDAVAALRSAVSDFQSAPRALLRFTEPRDALAADATELLAQALAQLGDGPQARSLLESALATRESYLAKEPGLWRWKQELARTSVLLGGLLDPVNAGDAPRRRTLLDRAAAILTGPENSGRLTVANQELLAQVQRLRGEVQNTSGLEGLFPN